MCVVSIPSSRPSSSHCENLDLSLVRLFVFLFGRCFVERFHAALVNLFYGTTFSVPYSVRSLVVIEQWQG